jgi:capsular polysaccharide biosynthesis protein
MADSQGGRINKNSAATEKKDEVYLEDEINLIDYFVILWKRKYFIFLATVLPTLIVGITLFLGPRDYKITYTYNVNDWNLTEKNCNILISRFYSEENLDEIINKLQEGGLNKYAELIKKTGNNLNALMKVLKIEPVPAYIDLSKLTTADPEKITQAQKLTAQLLNVSVVGKDKNKFTQMALVIKDNFEKDAPVYTLEEQLAADIRLYRTRMGDIESDRFNLGLELKANKDMLEKLKKIKSALPDNTGGNVVLQFDIGPKVEYLPVSYQIQAIESRIVGLEKQISTNEQNYSYYSNVLDLEEKILAVLKDKTSSCRTIEQFRSIVVDMARKCDKQELKDYLNSYIKSIENRISDTVPTTETPRIYPIAKGTVKKSGVVFVIAFMVSVFSAFLWEGLEKNRTRIS